MIQYISFSHPICRWVEDGSLVDDGSGSFTNWDQAPPPDPNGAESENCMQMSYDGTWRDNDCDVDFYWAICSKPIKSANAAARNSITLA